MSYWFAGDIVGSTIPLKLANAADQPTVMITVRRTTEQHSPVALDSYVFRGFLDGGLWFLGRNVGDDCWRFTAAGGAWGSISDDLATITIDALDVVPERWLAEVISNWVLSFRLALAGRWCFHGSVVVSPFDGAALALLGPTGAGKTTTAVACQLLGAEVIADDLVAGVIEGDAVVMHSTSANLKLRTTASALLHGAAAPVADFDDRLDVPARGTTRSAPLARVCFLNRKAGAGTISPVSGALAAQRLMENSKLVMWTDLEFLEREFDSACAIAARVEAVEADLPDLSGGLTDAARTVLRELLGG